MSCRRLRVGFLSHVALAVGILSFTFPAVNYAQDSHYWLTQFGARASLLGGAVIGSSEDISATYYNPGALSLADSLAFAVSANLLESSKVSLETSAATRTELGTSKTGFRPSLVAGVLSRSAPGDGILAYSLLTRTSSDTEFNALGILGAADLPPGTGLDDLVAHFHYEQKVSDVWAGLSYSRPLGEDLGLGVTLYGASRSQNRRQEILLQGIQNDRAGRTQIRIVDGEFNTIRGLAKLGLYGSKGPVSGGLTLTTPSVNVMGSGEIAFTSSITQPDTSVLVATSQKDVDATYKSPLSVGAGLGWRVGRTLLLASAEWFNAVDTYTVMEGEDFTAQEPQASYPLAIVQTQNGVLNWAFGVEHALSPDFNAFGSFAMDRAVVDGDIQADLSRSVYDIKSFHLGADFRVGPVGLTLGGGYAWGSAVDQELSDFLRGNDSEFEASTVYRNVDLLFGFDIGGR